MKLLANQSRLDCIEKKSDALLFVRAEKSDHNKLDIRQEVGEESEDWVERIFDSLHQEVGQVFIIIQEEIESVLR